MKKIAVLTFYTSKNNYGQILQGYALQTYLKQMGFQAYIVKFNSFKSLMKEWGTMLLSPQLIHRKFDNLRKFREFKHNISYSSKTYYSFSSLNRNFPQADIVITGSDQVWAHMRNIERRKAYLLNFDNKIPKMSYAASFGRNHLQNEEKKMYRTALEQYTTVLVREMSGVEICRELGIDATVVCDPVALLNCDQWRKLETSVPLLQNGKKYIFVYSLAEGNYDNLSALIESMKGEFNFVTTYIGQKGKKSSVFPTVPEWLGYIDQCDFVITDSFHGTLFSILLGTPFITIKSKERATMSDRLLTLFHYTGLSERYIDITDVQKVDSFLKDNMPLTIDSKLEQLINVSKERFKDNLLKSLKHK